MADIKLIDSQTFLNEFQNILRKANETCFKEIPDSWEKCLKDLEKSKKDLENFTSLCVRAKESKLPISLLSEISYD